MEPGAGESPAWGRVRGGAHRCPRPAPRASGRCERGTGTFFWGAGVRVKMTRRRGAGAGLSELWGVWRGASLPLRGRFCAAFWERGASPAVTARPPGFAGRWGFPFAEPRSPKAVLLAGRREGPGCRSAGDRCTFRLLMLRRCPGGVVPPGVRGRGSLCLCVWPRFTPYIVYLRC